MEPVFHKQIFFLLTSRSFFVVMVIDGKAVTSIYSLSFVFSLKSPTGHSCLLFFKHLLCLPVPAGESLSSQPELRTILLLPGYVKAPHDSLLMFNRALYSHFLASTVTLHTP